ncbi:MAG: alanine racemase [Paraglaciecola sp.]|nr:alanine racemase [Paraglaciecola sp.]
MNVLADLNTPCLLLDESKMRANQNRMIKQVKNRSCSLRPHLKTLKSVSAARYVLGGTDCPITVSTLKEAQEFGRAGFKDILYAVAITAQKLDHVVSLRREGIDLKVLIDSEEMANAIASKSNKTGEAIPAFIEIDVDGHRAGISIDESGRLIDIARRLEQGGKLHGVMAHAGESYNLSDTKLICESALNEATKAVKMANVLRAAGFECHHVSVGSTPTALARIEVQGVTEIRAGVYLFFDLVQAGVGVCKKVNIALSVLTTVNGWNSKKRQIFIDAGWMALSRDRGTANQATDQYFGIVCDEAGNIIPDLVVIETNQEHGIITSRPNLEQKMEQETPHLPIGTRLRILPNHACATAAQHETYHVLNAEGKLIENWSRFGGW